MTYIPSPAFTSDTDIAVIGMACRFPGAEDTLQYWRNLRDGVESVRFFSDEELLKAGVDAALLRSPQYVKAHAVLDGIETFDAGFFGITPREAEILDPQQRVFLECAWESLENAGYDAERCAGAVGVFAGAGLNYYLFHNIYPNPQYLESMGGYQVMLANGRDFLPTRVSYKLNLRGPSVNVQTACSTSLVAVHMAVQSLLMGECDMALAGAASLQIPQVAGYLYQEGMILSPDGHCRAFDAEGKGIVVGDGVGIVVLKRLADALADRDSIRAVIKGSAINNDGARKVGYTAPSIEGQSAVILEALQVGRVDPDSVTYVEAHGTATPLGDPVEIEALTEAFRKSTSRKGFCAIGSVKSNFGHLDTAAGVAGLIKTILAMEHGSIPPSLHFRKANPQIDFANSPFTVNTHLTPWPVADAPRRAGVSSFGIGGTNAHVVVQEAPLRQPGTGQLEWQLLPLSARTSQSLERAANRLADHLASSGEADLADAAYTLAVGRKAFEHRRAVVASGRAAADLLRKRPLVSERAVEGRPAVAFLFSGQGSQYVGMTAGLYRAEPSFRDELDACAELLAGLGVDLRQALFPAQQGAAAEEHLRATAVAQPTLFAVEYSLARLLMKWGIVPDSMCGHSIGEYVAACLAEVFSLKDALRLVVERGRLMQGMQTGVMLAVPLNEKMLRHRLNGGLSLAAVNAPSLCVVSGTSEAAAVLEAALAGEGVTCRRLHTSHAFHSAMMDPVLDRFTELVGSVELRRPKTPFISNLSGTWITPEQARNPGYWAQHLRQTVRFDDGMRELAKMPRRVCVEIGPGRVLTTLASPHLQKASGQLAVPTLRHPSEQEDDLPFLLKAIGELWTAGAEIDWQQFYSGQSRNRVPVPTYPFERQRYWIDPPKPGTTVVTAKVPVDREHDLRNWFYVPVWKPTAIPSGGAAPTRWLLFSDGSPLSVATKQELAAAGHRVITVLAGTAFERVDDGTYKMHPDSAADYQQLLRAIGGRPAMVAHFWSRPERTLNYGMYSLVHLAQAIGQTSDASPMSIAVVTSGAVAAIPGENTHPEKATLLGPVRVIPHEYEAVRCRLIDLGASTDSVSAAALVNELCSAADDPILAYRGRTRLVQTFEPLGLAASSGTVPLRERGVYLITGGTGGIGMTIARHLAKTVGARLVLVGRRAAPEALIRDLETNGAECLCVSVDVADRDAVAEAVEKAIGRFATIDGVFHCAGVPGGGAMQQRSREQMESVLAPKVAGTLNLEAVLEGRALDFFLLCSSVTAILGGFGQMDYCAANAFLDAFAEQRAQKGHATISINWGSWEQVGMAARAVNIAGLADRGRIAGIPPEQGVDALARAMGAGLSRVAIAAHDFRKTGREELSPLFHNTACDVTPAAFTSEPRQERPELTTDYAAPRNETERSIAAIWEELLGIRGIGVFDSFLELGGHSLLATQLMSRIRVACGAGLPMAAVFEEPTIAGLAARVDLLKRAEPLLAAPSEPAGEFEEEGEV